MGLNRNEIQVLVDLNREMGGLKSVLTLGRQWLLCDREELSDLLTRNGYAADKIAALLKEDLTYIDPVLLFIGAQSVATMDFSDYENASVIHDLNNRLPEKYRKTYDCVIDGGTIEHVFNVPEALRSCMDLCRVGGYVFLTNPANNQCGHGFYQFSPELMFRVFSEANGFAAPKVLMAETFPRNGCHSGLMKIVNDPADIHQRIILDAGMPVQMITVAKRLQDIPIFARTPQQSDYEAAWQGSGPESSSGPTARSGLKGSILELLDKRWMRLGQLIRTVTNPLKNEKYYR